MYSRFVAKWKIVIEKGVRKKLLRMRMTLRGFKDLEADRLVRYYMRLQLQDNLKDSFRVKLHATTTGSS